MSRAVRRLVPVEDDQPAETDARLIGELYWKAKKSLVDAVHFAAECGRMLLAKKKSLAHGEWLPWLEANAELLGFDTPRTAQRLMELAGNTSLASHLDEASAVQISRELWGHRDAELILSSESNEWYTPALYVDAARLALGSIDLDPASCEAANKIVRAKTFYSKDDDGLKQDWRGNVWLNPPYGGLAGPFIERLVNEHKAGHVRAAVVLLNSHCVDCIWFQPLWDYLLCFTNHRIQFDCVGRENLARSTHGSVFVYLGEQQRRFGEHFERFGFLMATAGISSRAAL
jgi:ParB family chromosome partitioning protein